MANLTEVEKLLTDVNERLKAIPQELFEKGILTEEQIKGIVQDIVKSWIDDPNSEFSRKMRFGKSPEAIQGSKFARWNLEVADIEFLYDVMKARQTSGLGSGPSTDLENCFKAVSEAFFLSQDEVQKIDRQAIDNLFPRVSKANQKAFEAAIKAMDSAESGYGQQLIGAQYVGDLWEAARCETRVFNLCHSFEMTAPTAYLPVEADIPEMLFVAENTSPTAFPSSAYATSKTGSNRVQVDAKKFVIHQVWSGELEEDSIIPFVPFLRRQLALALAHYLDSLVLNGDTTNAATGNINLDDADPANTKHYLAFDGLRHAGLVDNTANSKDAAGAITYNLLIGQKARMVDRTYLMDWGHPTNPEDLVYVADIETGDAIALLDEVKTVDKYGPQATVMNGEIAKIGRHPLVTSILMSKTEADGKVSTTAGNNTQGQVVAFNRRGCVNGWRRRIKIEVERIPSTDQTRLVASLRLGHGRYSPTGAASGIESVDVLYNISL